MKQENTQEGYIDAVTLFQVSNINEHPEHESKTVYFSAVINGSEENKSFSKYTPSGNLTLTISYDTKAVDFLQQGKEYYLDFTSAAE